MICQRFFDIATIQNQVAKRQLNFIGKVTRNSDEKLPTELLTEWCNNKRQVAGVLYSKKKTLVQKISLIVPTVDRYGSLKLWAHLALNDRYWKYLINGIINTPTPPPGPPPSPNTKRAQPPSPLSPPRPIQAPPTSPPPRHRERPSPTPSPQEAPTPPQDTEH